MRGLLSTLVRPTPLTPSLNRPARSQKGDMALAPRNGLLDGGAEARTRPSASAAGMTAQPRPRLVAPASQGRCQEAAHLAWSAAILARAGVPGQRWCAAPVRRPSHP